MTPAGRERPGAPRPIPMFPLGTVLFPGGVLPLHVFEPRYRAMVKHCLEADAGFGVVLIARGSEVGGGDERYSVATEARIEEAAELPDGRWALLATGIRRIAVEDWLPDDPFPRASVSSLPSAGGAAGPDALAEALAVVRRATALLSELGRSGLPGAPATLPDDPEEAAWQVCDARAARPPRPPAAARGGRAGRAGGAGHPPGRRGRRGSRAAALRGRVPVGGRTGGGR